MCMGGPVKRECMCLRCVPAKVSVIMSCSEACKLNDWPLTCMCLSRVPAKVSVSCSEACKSNDWPLIFFLLLTYSIAFTISRCTLFTLGLFCQYVPIKPCGLDL